MKLRMLPLAMALAAAASAGAAAAGEAQDLIFRVGLLDPVATGQTLVYHHERSGALAAEPVPPIEDGTVEIALTEGDDGRAARLEIAEAGVPRSRALLPAGGGHPVLLMFLESSARNVAALTGGSPFYIRNRMREALAEEVAVEPVELDLGAETVPAEAMTFRPFIDDPNHAALGAFADLALTMVLSDAVPGAFARFEAAAGPGTGGTPAFTETIAFDHIEEE